MLDKRGPRDWSLWTAIDAIAMADLSTTDRPYLYGPQDFAAWLEELDSDGKAN